MFVLDKQWHHVLVISNYFFEGGAEMPNLYDQQTNNPLKPFRKALNALMILASTPTPKFKLRVTKVS